MFYKFFILNYANPVVSLKCRILICFVYLAENYLLAFCVGDRKSEMLHLLNVLDVRRISSLEYLSVIFKTLGKSSLENLAMESILSLKSGGMYVFHVDSAGVRHFHIFFVTHLKYNFFQCVKMFQPCNLNFFIFSPFICLFGASS